MLPNNEIPKIQFSYLGGKQTISFKAKDLWYVETKSTEPTDWFDISQEKGEAGTFMLDITAKENGVESRDAQIILHCWDDAITMDVIQAQKDALVIGKSAYTIDNKGGEIELAVGHNVDFETSISVDWITKHETRAYVEDKLIFNIAENTSYDNREGKIIFTSKDGKLKQEVKVYQTQTNAIVLNQKDYIFSNDKQAFDLIVKSNVNVNFSYNREWIHLIQTRG